MRLFGVEFGYLYPGLTWKEKFVAYSFSKIRVRSNLIGVSLWAAGAYLLPKIVDGCIPDNSCALFGMAVGTLFAERYRYIANQGTGQPLTMSELEAESPEFAKYIATLENKVT